MQDLLDHLEFLYGEDVARETLPKLQACLEKYFGPVSPEPPKVADELPLTQADNLLITYGDQVREPGKSTLQSLGEFLTKHTTEVLEGVHFLPFFPYSSDDGFSVIDYYQIDPALGDWDDVEEISKSFKLMFDAVVNHMSAKSEWFAKYLAGDPEFQGYFMSVEGDPDLSEVIRPRALPLLTEFETASGPKRLWTTFSADQVDLNAHSPDTLVALIDVLLCYASKGAKFIRLDAIAFLWKEIGTTCLHLPQTHRAVQLMRSVFDYVAPDVMLITETNVPHEFNISYFGDGTNEAQLVYNFALPPLTLHALANGNAKVLSQWASSLKLPSKRTTFFNFLASHDGIGVNPARGILPESEIEKLKERVLAHGGLIGYKNNPDGSRSPYELNINYFDALSNPLDRDEPLERQVDRFMVAQSIMLSLRGMPGIYVHSLFGSRNDRAAADESGIPRRINRAKFDRADLERDLADPTSLRSLVWTRYQQMLKARKGCAAFHPLGGEEVLDAGEAFFVLWRSSPDGTERCLCLHNVTDEDLEVDMPSPDPKVASWNDLLKEGTKLAGTERIKLPLPAYGVVWLKAE